MKRNPNGYGTVTKLSGNRRRPYAAYSDRYFVGVKPKRDVIGYFETEAEARDALAAWNRTRGTKMNATFEDLFNEWFAEYRRNASKQAVYAYSAAWKRLTPLYRLKARDVRTGHFQRIIDGMQADGLSYSSISNVKTVCDFVEKYAMQYDIVVKNYAELIRLPDRVQKEKERFSDDDLRKISELAEKGDRCAQIIMILCFTGWRINELLSMSRSAYDPQTNTLFGGNKTHDGKERYVPVHPIIAPYLQRFLDDSGDNIFMRSSKRGMIPLRAGYFRASMFTPLMQQLGIKRTDGTDFTPHAMRHTFASLAKKNGLDPFLTKKLLGHSPKSDVTERVYTHVDLDMLNKAVAQLRKD